MKRVALGDYNESSELCEWKVSVMELQKLGLVVVYKTQFIAIF